MILASSVTSACEVPALYPVTVVAMPAARPPTPIVVLAIEVAVWTALATALIVSEVALAIWAKPAAMPPMLQEREAAMMAMLMMSAAASLAFCLSMPDFSSALARPSIILSMAPVSFRMSEVTAMAAPAMANPAAAPPVTTVVTTAATTARMAPSQPKMRLAVRALAASSIFLIDSVILSLR